MARARSTTRTPAAGAVRSHANAAAERAATLGGALEIWRATRSRLAAEAIDALGDAALAAWPPPTPRTNRAFHAAWLAALSDDARRGWAARTLFARLPGKDSDERLAAGCERLAALRGAPGDPRIGSAAVELIGQSLQILGYAEVLDGIVGVLAVHGDERTAAIARRRLETADPADVAVLARVLAGQPRAERMIADDERAALAAHRVRPAAASDQVAALLREVHARPDDDDPRHVLADAQLAAGDPRGELIALQLVGEPDAPQLDRIDQLLREHGKSWLGPLREITYRARFERGFLARLELNGRWTATEQGWARHAVDPMLATVEDVIPGRAVGAIYAQFVTSAAMTALRRIEVFDPPSLEALRETSAQLVHVACPRWKGGKYVPQLARHVLPACERFAELRSFGVYIDGADGVLASRLIDQLTSLIVAGNLARGLALWPRLPSGVSLTLARSAMLEDCVTTRVAWTGALQLVRDGGGVIARCSGAWLINELVDQLAALPSDLRRLEIEGAGVHAAALTDAANRRRIELVLRPLARRSGYIAGLDK